MTLFFPKVFTVFILLLFVITIMDSGPISSNAASSANLISQPLTLSLNGIWNIRSIDGEKKIKGTVPGNVHTALKEFTGHPASYLYRFGDDDYRWISKLDWVYERAFSVPEEILKSPFIYLVARGLDTISSLHLNGKTIGKSSNMFVRYSFEVNKMLLLKNNKLAINFTSPVTYAKAKAKMYNYYIPPDCRPSVEHGDCDVNKIRKEPCSFGWDWGPSFPTTGIWKDIFLLGVHDLYLEDTTVHPRLLQSGRWQVTVKLFCKVFKPVSATVLLIIDGQHKFQSSVMLRDNTVSVSFELPDNYRHKLWWPNGFGDQTLLSLHLELKTSVTSVNRKIRFGLRTLELVQSTAPANDGLTFYFKVNGYPIFMKGSNWIPASNFEDKVGEATLRNLLYSAADAHMNMLRVWGGGVYESDKFYEICDELGLLIWQDFMFACATYPADKEFLLSVSDEVQQQVRRLQHHPSIALWAGNNENEIAIMSGWWSLNPMSRYKADYVHLFIDTIKTIVNKEDPVGIYLPSSPSNGKVTEKEGWLASNPGDGHYGDTHRYDYEQNGWDWHMYQPTRFCSEYGYQSWPSISLLRKYATEEDLVFGSKFVEHRQHFPNGNNVVKGLIQQNLKLPSTRDASKWFEGFVYLSQIYQAKFMQTQTGVYMKDCSDPTKTMGALYWQLNSLWPAPTWSSLEYGGRWKMLHYYMKRCFQPITIFPYIDHDKVLVSLIQSSVSLSEPFVLTMSVHSWDSFKVLHSETLKDIRPSGHSEVVAKFPISDVLSGANSERANTFLVLDLHDHIEDWIALSTVKDIKNAKRAKIIISSVSEVKKSTFSIHLSTDAPALFVWLEASDHEGRFSDNGFLMWQPNKEVFFHAWKETSANALKADLTVMSLYDLY